MIQSGVRYIGPIEGLRPYLEDPEVTDILVNGPGELFVERRGELVREPSPFPDGGSLQELIERLLIPIGRRVDASQPFVDGRMFDGSRFHVLLPPIATKGPYISIRKFRSDFDSGNLSDMGPPELMAWLDEQVRLRKNIVICGGTGVGKTTLLARILAKVSPFERIAVIEETREIPALHPHLVSLEARAATPDGIGAVTLRSLIRNALRMRPDRIVLGECRGEEAFDLVQAMNTGHRGSFSTLHANGGRDALRRLEALVLLSGFPIPLGVVREWIGGTVDHVLYLRRVGGQRSIGEVISLLGVEGDMYRIRPRFINSQVLDLD